MATNRYSKILTSIFQAKYRKDDTEVSFDRDEFADHADKHKIVLPKNLGDVIYTFRYRSAMPDEIRKTAPEGRAWMIQPAGRGAYKFRLETELLLEPNPNLAITRVPNSTPGLIAMYSLSDEQALLAKLRYSRLIDIFTGLACHSLQNHLRSSVKGMGQVEIDEIYVGVDRHGAHYVIPVQAKGGRDRLSPIQIGQDIALCSEKFPALICRPIAAQFFGTNKIALFEFRETRDGLRVIDERHYELAPPSELTDEEIAQYAAVARTKDA